MPHRGPRDPYDQLPYLRILAGDASPNALLEVRWRLAGDGMATRFFPVADRSALLTCVNERAASTDVYVGCAPRVRPDGRRQAVEQVWTLWAECDGAAASEAARAHLPRPALVVASGTPGNVHAYWPLRRSLGPEDAERANLRLALALGADRNCFDAGRILRPPGTWNHKRRPPARVSIVDQRLAVRFDVDEVVGGLPHVSAAEVERRWEEREPRRNRRDPLQRIAPPAYVSELLGVRAVAGRKVACPFHSDEHPSLHVYPTPDRGWFCFSCRRGGTIYDFAAALWGVQTRGRDFLRVRRRLEQVFESELARGVWARDPRGDL